MSHTPGPWKIRPTAFGRSGFYIETVDQSHDKTFIGDVGGGLQTQPEIEANANLIAAAPDMLDFAIHVINSTMFGSDLNNRAQDVIKKATGE